MPRSWGKGVDPTVRVLILNDHDLVRYSCRKALAAQPIIDVVGDTSAVDEAISMLSLSRPHVVIVDTLRASGDGISAARRIRAADASVRVLLLVSEADIQAIATAVLTGASGYVRRNAAVLIASAVMLLANGRLLLDPADIRSAHTWLREQLRTDEYPQPQGRLRDRILNLVLAGYTNPDIVAHFHIPLAAVDRHFADILNHLHLPGTVVPAPRPGVATERSNVAEGVRSVALRGAS